MHMHTVTHKTWPAVVGPWSLHCVEAGASGGGRKVRPGRLDYLALPAREGEHDFRLAVRELLLSIMYEQLERWVGGPGSSLG